MDSFPVKFQKEMSLLGFDFGTKRIGSAVGQTLSGTASALHAIAAKDGIPDWDALDALVAQWQPNAFVVGLPYNMDDSKSELFLRARKFGNRLNGRYCKPCFGMDERLSSFEARGLIMRKESDAQLDCLAAQLILESWLAAYKEHFKHSQAD
ncbi:MAG: Holliday junction resolvase RuvX [Pseudohongiellaceae bacterium]|nr:Holliday junction resolvase RuvX [Pseudohongiellaceae bacterium]